MPTLTLALAEAPLPPGALPIPHGAGSALPLKLHLGLYAYKAALLEKFAGLPVGRLEQIERLEQLRVLENGFSIACDLTEDPTIGVDTPRWNWRRSNTAAARGARNA